MDSLEKADNYVIELMGQVIDPNETIIEIREYVGCYDHYFNEEYTGICYQYADHLYCRKCCYDSD